MIRLHDRGELREFADADAIISHFALTDLRGETFAGIRAASDAGFPLHACVDPYSEDIHDRRTLLLDNSAADLRTQYRQRRSDI